MKTLTFSLLFSIVMLLSSSIQAQVTIGSNADPNINAILDLKNNANENTSTKGLLLPRVELTSTTAYTPLTAHVAGMTVYNTTTTGDVTPGYYYNNGTKWVRIADFATEPWYNAATNTGATANTQNIYQTGSVGIGAAPLSGVKLQVATANSDDIVFSRFLSSPKNDDLDVDFVRGYGSITAPAVVLDSAARLGGIRARTFIDLSKIGTDPGTAFSPSAEISFETDGVPSTTSSPGRILFMTTPAGSTSGNTRMTIEKNGYVGVNNDHPTNRLHVSATANPLRLEGLTSGATTDSLLTTDASGVVHRRNASALYKAGKLINITGNTISKVNNIVVATVSGSTIALDAQSYTEGIYRVSGAANFTISAFSNAVSGGIYNLHILNTGASTITVTLPANFLREDLTTLTSIPVYSGSAEMITFYYYDNKYYTMEQ